MCFPLEREALVLRTCDAKSELDHKNHERGIVKLAFLMQGHIKFHRAQFCWLLARHWLVFFENRKIDPRMVLRRPGGMHGGAGGDMKGSEICRFEICNFGLVLSI